MKYLMKHLIIAIVIAIAISTMHLATALASINSPEELSSFIETYHKHPQPEKLTDLVDYLVDKQVLKDKHIIAPISGFLNGIFATDDLAMISTLKHIAKVNDIELSRIASISLRCTTTKEANETLRNNYLGLTENDLQCEVDPNLWTVLVSS